MTFKPNSDGFRKLANGPEVRAMLQAKGEEAVAIAKGLAESFRVTGEYADSFDVEQTTVDLSERPRPARFPGPRAAVRVINRAPYAAAVEYGYEGDAIEEGMTAHHVLARTLDALGRPE